MNRHDILDKLTNPQCDGNIMLEPRLQEYIKKRKFHKDNNITPIVSPDKEFQITNHDKKIIRSFLTGNRNIYNNPHFSKNNIKHTTPPKTHFDSVKYRSYDKYDRITPKPEPTPQPPNMGLFVPDKNDAYYDVIVKNPEYAIDARDFKIQEEACIPPPRDTLRTDPKIQLPPCNITNTDKSTSKYRTNNEFTCSRTKPKNTEPLPPQSDNYHLLDPTTQKLLDEYKKQPSRLTESFLPNSNQNNDERYENQFNSLIESDFETERISSIPEHTKKSYGYRDLSEHYFDYLESKEEFTTNALEPWYRGGEITRLDNKKTARKQFTREWM